MRLSKSEFSPYDAWGRQTGYAEPQNLVTVSYTYGADGLRKSKTVGGTTTTFVWDGANLVYESSGATYTYGATLIKSSNGSATYVYVFNGHGDVVQLLAGTSVVKNYSYDAFGNQVGINAADANPFRYCGEYYDKESGTIYLRARYYSPVTGRFTQQDGWQFADPRDPLSLNLYTYCWNNPITFIDLMGNWPTWSQIGKAALIAAVAAVSVVAIVATAGTAAAAVGTGVAMYIGASAATATTITTVATAGAWGVAAGVGAVAVSDIGEVFTGHNVIRDDLMGGNQQTYDSLRVMLNLLTSGIVEIGITNPKISEVKFNFKKGELKKHYNLHSGQIKQLLGNDNYSIDDYFNDANYIINNGQYVEELNGYIRFIGGNKYAFVGLDRDTAEITTYHIKSIQQLQQKAPSLGFEW